MAVGNTGNVKAPTTYITWSETSITVAIGGEVTTTYTGTSQPLVQSNVEGFLSGVATADTATANSVTFTGVSAGTATIPTDSVVGGSIYTTNALTITVTGAAEDESYLNKRGLTHFWENIDDIKQNKLTAGAGILITNDVISATGGGTADAVDWGHITGSMSNQTDLTTALNAKANSTDLATVATSGSYNDLSDKPTIPSLTRRIDTSTPATVGSLVLGGNGTSALPYAFPTIVGTNDESFWSYIRTTDITNGISEAYLGAYEFDPTESWWSGKKEARLALYSDIPTVPTKTSDLTNDSGFLTSVAWGDVTGKPTFATVATSGDYDDLTDKPTIGNATLTIQKNGTSAGTFTANATSNKTINITVPVTAADVSALPSSTKYGASFTASINTTTYVMTLTLKDQDGNTLGTAQTIDLPLESVVVNGSYDSTNKKIVLTLQSGSTIDIPVGDLISGLQTEITSSNKLASDLVDDTNQTHKFTTAADITKLAGIATGAEVNQNAFSNVKVGSTTVAADSKTDTIELVAGSNVTLTPDATNDKVTIAATDTTYSDATTSASGLMSASDKTKLDGIASGAEVNVQSNWNQTDSAADDFIKNKPTIPSSYRLGVASGNTDTQVSVPFTTLLHLRAGDNVGLSTTSGTGYRDVTINAVVPTKTSDLTNDSGFLDSVAWGDVTGKPTFATVATSGSYDDLSNKPTIPAAQVNSDWNANSGVAQILNKPTIPANTSDLNNDSGFLTSSNAVTSFNGSTGAVTYTAPVTSVNGSTGAVTISVPTKTSDLVNDSGFIDTVDNALSPTSTNPVQNAVIDNEIDGLNSAINGKISTGNVQASDMTADSVTTTAIEDAAVTSDKIDWTTITSTDLSSSFTWDSGMSTSSANDRVIYLCKNGNIAFMTIFIGARSNYQLTTSWVNMGTLPVGTRPIHEISGPITANNRDSGQPTGYGKFTISTAGLIRVRANSTVTNCQALFGGISWPVA